MRRTTRQLHDEIRTLHASAVSPSENLDRSLRFVQLAENEIHTTRRGESNWLWKIESVELFTDLWRRLQRHTRGSDRPLVEEGRLADWLDTQRDNRPTLCLYQERRLEALPQFIWDPREERWQQRLQDCHQFLADHGQLPRIRSDDFAEKSLARWMYEQRDRQRNGRLRRDQRAAFAPFNGLAR